MRAKRIVRGVFATLLVLIIILFGIKIVNSSVPKEVVPKKGGEVLNATPNTNNEFEFKPILKTLHSKAGVVIEATTGKVLFAENAFEVLPIASITKLMSSMVALDSEIDLNKVVTIPPDDYRVGGNLRIVAGKETVALKDLIYASITGSANNAALTVASNTNLTAEDFVAAMNRKAVELKLETLHFKEPSGLSSENVGSAYDVARMAGYAFSHYPLVLDAASQKEYKIITQNTKREHMIKNSNTLYWRATGQFDASKTGYLDEALYCLVLAKNTPKGTIVAITLGNPAKDDGENETLELLHKGEETLNQIIN